MEKVKLLQLENKDGYEYWVALHNFYVITRYNHSALYAMAVYQLADAIRAAASTRPHGFLKVFSEDTNGVLPLGNVEKKQYEQQVR